MMGEARNDMENEKKAVSAAQEEREARKIKIGKDLVAGSLRQQCFHSEKGTEDDGQEKTGEKERQGSARKSAESRWHAPEARSRQSWSISG